MNIPVKDKRGLVKILFSLLFVLFFTGCGYTTQSLLNSEYKTVYISPVVNKIQFTGESQEYSKFRSVPPLLADRLTKSLISMFNLDGHLKTVKEGVSDLTLSCEINDYVRDTLRYDDNNNVEEYRLKLYLTYSLTDNRGELKDKKSIVADIEYSLTGSAAKSEASALNDLVDDASRRVVEDIIEAW